MPSGGGSSVQQSFTLQTHECMKQLSEKVGQSSASDVALCGRHSLEESGDPYEIHSLSYWITGNQWVTHLIRWRLKASVVSK